MKTLGQVRFSQVVAQSGKPQPYTLWLEPKDDPAFQRALKENRILSVRQETTGTKADYGEVGYTGQRGELLLFPKSLRGFEGKRVVGVKYDLLSLPEASPTPSKAAPAQARPVAPKAPRAPKTALTTPAHTNIVPFPQGDNLDEERQPSPSAPTPSNRPDAPAPKDATKLPLPRRRRTQGPAAKATKPEAKPSPSAPPSKPLELAPGTPKDNSHPTRANQTSTAPASALRLLRRAMRDLKEGRAVKAYEGLQKLESLLTS